MERCETDGGADPLSPYDLHKLSWGPTKLRFTHIESLLPHIYVGPKIAPTFLSARILETVQKMYKKTAVYAHC